MKWKAWAGSRIEVKIFPVDEVHFAFYLQHVANTTSSRASVEEAVNAISWAHQLAAFHQLAPQHSFGQLWLAYNAN